MFSSFFLVFYFKFSPHTRVESLTVCQFKQSLIFLCVCFNPWSGKKCCSFLGMCQNKKKKEKCQVLSFRIKPGKVYEMIHHFLASAIITAVTNLYLLAPLKDVLNVTVSSKSYCFNWINNKKNQSITDVCFKQEIMLISRTLRAAFLELAW